MGSRGNSSTYLKERLKRDYPSFYARLVKGEFRSAHAAAVAARIIKKHTPLWTLQRAWLRALQSEKQAFLCWIEDRGESRMHPHAETRRVLTGKALASLPPEEQVAQIRENEQRVRDRAKAQTRQARKR